PHLLEATAHPRRDSRRVRRATSHRRPRYSRRHARGDGAMRSAIVALVVALTAHVAAARQVTYAIVIGNNAPPRTGTPEKLQPLRYADDDAVRYFQLFSRLAETHLLVVLDTQTQKRYPGVAEHAQPPTLENLNRTVDELVVKMRADRQRGDSPVLYFA